MLGWLVITQAVPAGPSAEGVVVASASLAWLGGTSGYLTCRLVEVCGAFVRQGTGDF